MTASERRSIGQSVNICVGFETCAARPNKADCDSQRKYRGQGRRQPQPFTAHQVEQIGHGRRHDPAVRFAELQMVNEARHAGQKCRPADDD